MTEQALGRARRAGAALDRHAGAVFVAMALVAFAGLFYVGRHGSFFQDEWAFIRITGLGTLHDWFAPHNEHWSTVPFAIYRVLLNTIGLRSYLPYLALLLLLHATVAGAIFSLLRRDAGSYVALLGGGLFLVLGSGYQNLFWAFQIGFVGSVAAGLWALVALDERRSILAAVLLLIGSACSTLGLLFVGGAIVQLLMERRLRDLPPVLAVAAANTIWFVAIGHEGLTGSGSGQGLSNLPLLPGFVTAGVAGAISNAFGLGFAGLGGVAVIAALVLGAVVAVAWSIRAGQGVPARAVACAAILVALFVLIGFGRAQFGEAQATRSRYLYEGVALILVGGGALLGRRADVLAWASARPEGATPEPLSVSARALGWPGLLVPVAVLVLVVPGLIHNLIWIRPGARFFTDGAGELRATIALGKEFDRTLLRDGPPITRFSVPTPDILATTTLAWGSPAVDILVPSVVLKPAPRERDRALWRLVGGATLPRPAPPPADAPPLADLLGPDPASLPPGTGSTVEIVRADGLTTVEVGSCLRLEVDDSSTPASFTVVLPDGEAVAVAVDRGGTGRVRMNQLIPSDPVNEAPADFPAAKWVSVGAPRMGGDRPFIIRIALPEGTATAAVCPAKSGP